ncbi:MAG: flagellar hook capping FlgD N-terminal domain-containing protein [Bacillota bacterium]|nr:flagellar hook capping FlgD N-terminal domain-containing protein [Bacillota bacterium]MDW7683010.1 flagellar hook capping FlgD N-terminal domain-containing protein [Bacillota bacterium]
MTTTYGVSGSTTAAVPEKKTGAMQELGKDVFLQLMVTQLRYQDPLNPQDNSAFVAQMAQFTSLEQMQNLNDNMVRLLELQSGATNSAAALLGLMVTVGTEDGMPFTGRVDAVEYQNGRPQLVVDGKRFAMETLQKVTAGGESDGQE